jgi:putative transposase
VLLADLRIGRTHSRPSVQRQRLQQSRLQDPQVRPGLPGRFGSIWDARALVSPFLDFYNHHHRHSGIGYHTRASVHFGTAGVVKAQRALVLDAAYAAHPERFANERQEPPELPDPAWINKPKESTERAGHQAVSHGA